MCVCPRVCLAQDSQQGYETDEQSGFLQCVLELQVSLLTEMSAVECKNTFSFRETPQKEKGEVRRAASSSVGRFDPLLTGFNKARRRRWAGKKKKINLGAFIGLGRSL